MPRRHLIPFPVVNKILTCAVGGGLMGGVLYVALHPISYGIVNLCLLAGACCGISWAINHKKARQPPPSAHTAQSEGQPVMTTRYRHALVPQPIHHGNEGTSAIRRLWS